MAKGKAITPTPAPAPAPVAAAANGPSLFHQFLQALGRAGGVKSIKMQDTATQVVNSPLLNMVAQVTTVVTVEGDAAAMAALANANAQIEIAKGQAAAAIAQANAAAKGP